MNNIDCRPKKYKKKKYVANTSMCTIGCPYWNICQKDKDKKIKKTIDKDKYLTDISGL